MFPVVRQLGHTLESARAAVAAAAPKNRFVPSDFPARNNHTTLDKSGLRHRTAAPSVPAECGVRSVDVAFLT